MGQAISQEHPAVVLRSHYLRLRRLFVVAIAGVGGLAAAVVILATEDQSTVEQPRKGGKPPAAISTSRSRSVWAHQRRPALTGPGPTPQPPRTRRIATRWGARAFLAAYAPRDP
jgi:hypothetical protein